MSRNKPKRDGSIAMASLLIYPPFDAFEEFTHAYDNRVMKGKELYEFEKKWKISDAIDVTVREVFSGNSLVFSSKFRPPIDFGMGARDWERRIPIENSRQSWMNNFALVCLDVAHAKNWYNRMFKLKKLLTESNLPRRMCWSRAVTDMIAYHRNNKETELWRIAQSGLIDVGCPFARCEIRQLSDTLLSSVTTLAKTFVPTSEPVSLGTTPSSPFQKMHADNEGTSFCLSDYSLAVGQ